jgi:hypothetical protein
MDFPFLIFKEFSFSVIMKRVWNHAGLYELLMTLHVTAPEAAPAGRNFDAWWNLHLVLQPPK